MRMWMASLLLALACSGIDEVDGASLCSNLENGRRVRLTERLDPSSVAMFRPTLVLCEPGVCCNQGWYLYRVPGCERVAVVAADALPLQFNGIPQRLLCMSGAPCHDCPDPREEELSGTLRRAEDIFPAETPSDVDWCLVVDAEVSDAGRFDG
jgi:hypothetical protein